MSRAGETEVVIHYLGIGSGDNPTSHYVNLSLDTSFTPANQSLVAPTTQTASTLVSDSLGTRNYMTTFILDNDINPDDFAHIGVTRVSEGESPEWARRIFITSIEFRYASSL